MNRFLPQPAGLPAGTHPAGRRGAGMRPRLRAAALALAALTAAAVAAGCTAPAARPPAPAASGTPASTRASASPTASTAVPHCDPAASSLAPLPGPPQVTPGSFMAKIKARGYLIAGVDANTYHFEYFNPGDGSFEGFDIDMVRAVAQAIFGNPNQVEYKAISDADRETDVNNGSVDIVAHTMTINCARLEVVDFSTVYFDAHQQILVLDGSSVTGAASLAGQKVCATGGSDSMGGIAPFHPKAVLVPYITDCLVELQQGQVAAITSDNSILEGLEAQDPHTKIVGTYLEDEPYGLAIAKTHPDFVRFVNAVLEKERTSGAWQASYIKWVGSPAPQPPPAGYAS
jgi:polar amino acid transport system substrate-binding protein